MKTVRSDNIAQFFVDERDAATFPVTAVVSCRRPGEAVRYRPTEVDDVRALAALIAQAPGP